MRIFGIFASSFGIDARKCGARISAGASTCEEVHRPRRRVYNWPHLMVVPAIGIVVHNDYSRALPVGLLLQEIDECNKESLFIQWVGIPSMAILERRCLN